MVAAGLLALFFIPLGLARPASKSTNLMIRDHRTNPPKGFAPTGKALASDDLLHLTVAMPQGNATGLYDVLMDVSDPMSTNYGHHLTKSEVRRMLHSDA